MRKLAIVLTPLLILALVLGGCGGGGEGAATPTPRATPPLVLDADGDGWTDAHEESVGTDAHNVDTDGDGYRDPQDPNPLDANIPIAASTPTAAPTPTATPMPPFMPTIKLSVEAETIRVREAVQFVATVTFDDGTSATVTSEATWHSSNTKVATIDAEGLATGVAEGTTEITASFDAETSAGVTLVVTEPTPITPTLTPTSCENDPALIGTWHLSTINGEKPHYGWLTWTITEDTLTSAESVSDCTEISTYSSSGGILSCTEVLSVSGEGCGDEVGDSFTWGPYTVTDTTLTIVVTDLTMDPPTATFVFMKE